MPKHLFETFEPRRLMAATAAPFAEVGGRVVIEAEHAHARVTRRGQSWTDVAAPSGASGGAAVRAGPDVGRNDNRGYTATSPELQYRVKFADAGTYHVWLRGQADDGDGDSAHVGLDGQAVSTADRVGLSPGGGWAWSNLTMDGPTATIQIDKPGERTLNVWMREDGLRLDKIVLTQSGSYRPTGTGPAESARAAAKPVAAPKTPFDDLPWNVRRLTTTGERAAFSPDGKRLAYVSKAFGDAREIDLATGKTRTLTAGFGHAGFLRVQYLPNGDYLLVGPQKFTDAYDSRWRDAGLWVLRADLKSPPTWLGQKVHEGVAVSRLKDGANRIAWANSPLQHPELFPKEQFKNGNGSRMYTANVTYKNGVPSLAGKKQVFVTDQSTEAQDFFDSDTKITAPRYWSYASTFAVDTKAGTWSAYRDVAGEYNEPEGIFADGKSTLLESARDKGTGRGEGQNIDVWRFDLQKNGRGMSRLTRWGDFAGYKASNPVASPDGRFVAFQNARVGQTYGEGEGLFLLDLNATPPASRRVFADAFNDGRLPQSNGWSVGHAGPGKASVKSGGGRVDLGPSGGGSVATTLARTLDTRGLANVSLRLSAYQTAAGWDADDFVKIEYDTGYSWSRLLTDGQQFNGVDDASGDNPAGRVEGANTGFLALPASAAGHAALKVRITFRSDAPDEHYQLGYFEVRGTPT